MTESMHTIPIIHLWDNLLVPLQGDISDAQAERLRNALLQKSRAIEAEGLILDVSGVSVVDSHFCAVLAGITEAARLMGVHSMLCGLSPEVVMTLQAMGIELGGIETWPSLEEALEMLGIGPTRARGTGAEGSDHAAGEGSARGRPDAAPNEGEEPWEILLE